jgi:hypothetical protein
MNDKDAILAKILALTDSAFLPCRNWTKPAPMNTAQARRDFQKGGCPWRPGASSEGQRKSSERTLSTMADRGIIHVTRRSGLRWPMLKLSDAADWRTRGECGLPAQEGAWLVARELLKQSEEIPSWIPERALMGKNPDRHEAVAIENMMLPLLVRGFVVSGSNINGGVSYLLTPEGAAWLANCPKPKPDNGKENPEAVRIYDATITGELHRLQTEKIQDARELGMLPLSTSDCSIKQAITRNCSVKHNTGNGSRKTTSGKGRRK